MNITIQELDDLKNHLAEVLNAGLDKKIDPLIKRIEGVEAGVAGVDAVKKDVDDLKKNQGRALVGWTVLVAGVCLIFEQAKGWLVAKFLHTNG